MKKVVLYTGREFWLPEGMARAYKRDSGKDIPMDEYGRTMIIDRDDPNLIALVEKLKKIYDQIRKDPYVKLNRYGELDKHSEISFIQHFVIEEYDEKEFSYEIVVKDNDYGMWEELVLHPLISLRTIKAMSDDQIKKYFKDTFDLTVVD